VMLWAHEHQVANIVALIIGHRREVSGSAQFLTANMRSLTDVGVRPRRRFVSQMLVATWERANSAASER